MMAFVPTSCQHPISSIIVSRNNAVSGAVVDLVKFEWTRCLDGYEIRFDRDQPCGSEPKKEIVAKSEKVELYRPTEFPGLFQLFADKPANTEGMHEFAEGFGLLEGADREFIVERADLNVMLKHQAAMRHALELFDQGKSGELVIAFNNGGWGNLRIELDYDGGYRPLLPTDLSKRHQLRLVAPSLSSVLVPASLVQFMWLQIAMYAQSNVTLMRCDRCGSPFIVGTGTGRRSTAKFCGNACKVAAFRQRHGGMRTDA